MKNWFKNFHSWALQWGSTKWGAWVLFFCAFADASFLPLPTLMFFLALVLLNIKKVYKLALFGTLGTLFGAVLGYSIGHFAWLNANGEFTSFAQFILNHIPGFTEGIYNTIQIQYAKWNFWILFIASFIPVPYKIFSITSGVFDINILMFCIATLISQGIKFYILGLLIVKIGPEVKKLLDFKFKPFIIIATACIAIAIIVLKVF